MNTKSDTISIMWQAWRTYDANSYKWRYHGFKFWVHLPGISKTHLKNEVPMDLKPGEINPLGKIRKRAEAFIKELAPELAELPKQLGLDARFEVVFEENKITDADPPPGKSQAPGEID